MKNKRIAIFLALMMLVMAFAVSCGGGSSTSGGGASESGEAASGIAVEGTAIKIGVFEPTTGENGGGGMQEVLGARYANELFPSVSVDGTEYSIELVEVDNQSDKAAAVTAAQQLISQGVVAVIGSYGSGVSIAAGETFANAMVPAVGASCTNPQVTLGNEWYFRSCFLDPFQGTVMANYAIDSGYTKAAVISQNGDDYSTGLAQYFKQAFQNMGGEIVADVTYNTNESDFNALLTSIKSAGPDCLYSPTSIATATLLIPQAKANGISAQIMAGDTWENAAIISDAAVGVVLSTFFDEKDESNPVAKEFVDGFKTYLNADSQRLTWNAGTDTVAAVSALGYDTYMAIYHAIESLDGKGEAITSAAIRDALESVSFDGVTGAIAFDENGDAIKDTAYIKTISEESVATKEFQFLKTQSVADL